MHKQLKLCFFYIKINNSQNIILEIIAHDAERINVSCIKYVHEAELQWILHAEP